MIKCSMIKYFALFIICFAIILSGCEGEEKKVCAKCGGEATTTLSGPAKIIESHGISLSKCEQITSGVYTAHVCNSCIGPVVEITPDAGYTGKTIYD